jgi:hypothetical protein
MLPKEFGNRLRFLKFSPFLGVLTLGAFSVLIGLAYLLSPAWPPHAVCADHDCKEAREWISSAVTLIVLLGGLYQYRRSQLWKRAEFIAGEMKSFFADRHVIEALTMIDWSTRRINLLGSLSVDPKDWARVTREKQNGALLPHKLKPAAPDKTHADSEQINDPEQTADSDLAGYSREEVAIRDAYDAFLDGLERFAGFLNTGLVTVSDLRPYLRYWLDDIADQSTNQADNEWAFWLLSYVHFYKFTGTQDLLKAFQHDVSISSSLFAFFRSQVKDQALATKAVTLLDASLEAFSDDGVATT